MKAFRRNWAKLDLRYARKKKLTAYDVLIIASMIEKEVQVAKERPLVAAVIYNRLRVGLPLGIDATIRYGFDIPPTKAIRESQLDSDSPYNSRKRPGLPPTPIANPGLASLRAAARPASKNYLYFIRRPDCKSHSHGLRAGVRQLHQSRAAVLTARTRLVALLGHPVEHSLYTPRISQNAAFAARGLDWAYVALDVPRTCSRRRFAASRLPVSSART